MPASPAPDDPALKAGSDSARRFDLLWRNGPPPVLSDFLEGLEDLSLAQLVDVLLVDQHHRWRTGEPISARDYLERFPELKAHPELALDLVRSEYFIRKSIGDQTTQSDYACEFPQYEMLLRQQHESQRWMEETEASAIAGAPNPPETAIDSDVTCEQPEPRRSPGRISTITEVQHFRLPGFEIQNEIGRGGM
jgi:hypothetical protein